MGLWALCVRAADKEKDLCSNPKAMFYSGTAHGEFASAWNLLQWANIGLESPESGKSGAWLLSFRVGDYVMPLDCTKLLGLDVGFQLGPGHHDDRGSNMQACSTSTTR